jgi:hypothetical protein
MPVWCANASDGIITAQPYMNKNKPPRDIKGKHGAPFGETIYAECHRGNDKRDHLLVAETSPSRRRSSTEGR